MSILDDKPILSLFPGVGLLDRAFEEAGFHVFQAPDAIVGGDVRRVKLRPGWFSGIIGGPPCQDFSSLRRDEPTGYGRAMLDEFIRLVSEGAPEWFLIENVSRVPDVVVDGYAMQRLDVDLKWYAPATRLRHIQFGSRTARRLDIARGHDPRGLAGHASADNSAIGATRFDELDDSGASRFDELDDSGASRIAAEGELEESRFPDAARSRPRLPGAATASDKRSFAELVALQGLPEDFALPGFTIEGAKRAVGNGVPLPMGRVLAAAVLAAYGEEPAGTQLRLIEDVDVGRKCRCPCGRTVTGRRKYFDYSCRKRAQRRRDRAAAADETTEPAA